MLRKFFAVLLTLSLMTVSVQASSYNTMSRSNVVVKDESSLAFVNLQIEPKNEVETGSSIIISVTNATIFLQDIIDGTSSDENEYGYKVGGYQYQYISGGWNGKDSFSEVMPSLDTAQLPYKIRRINDKEMEVYLINLPDIYVNNSMDRVNGVGRTAYYSIPLTAYADGVGDISINIDSNGSTISDGVVGQAEIFEKKDETNTFIEASTETTTQETVTNSENNNEVVENGKKVEVTIGASYIVVNGEKIDIDAPSYIQEKSQSTLVPLRAVSEAFGGENSIEWIPETKTAIIKYKGNTVEFTANGDYMKINGVEKEMPNNVTAEISYGRMFVPFRVLGEAMGIDVSWEANSKTAIYTE
ncbi:MAG: copper amine oxidase N-terminal domain-containing protein [Lachnospirales bacterium]